MRVKPTARRRAVRPDEEGRPWRPVAVWGAVAIVAVALIALLFLALREPGALEGLRRVAGLSRGHDESVDYAGLDLPPAGGLHSGVWQNCGIYDEPIDTRNALHSMEHGAVWIAYQPELPEEDVATLREMVQGQTYVVLSPYPGLRSPVVLTAWGIQLEVDSVDDNRIPEFVARYQRGPQTPELGASCSNGTGQPLQ
ncbi:MAG: DUF3105 domain-containing protein [Chloroflexi bacterium]|nr:DUF3105 domain-containing protein [Chloroflexota bacterium]MCI0580306.1 DUF3105 domain-containing protein [Chloroflexota bacterium]MCI0648075.1 DUF3105 domain-containing protein [Chloroflexota bacterium]MCI0730906.1 DUF3105 domain-containing protein [Chloroflexota bacterium]